MHAISLISCGGELNQICPFGGYSGTWGISGTYRDAGRHMVMWRCTGDIQGCTQRHRGIQWGIQGYVGYIGDGAYSGMGVGHIQGNVGDMEDVQRDIQ